ncbi:MAG: hypothetical protein HY710_11265 [Candidatus Latescibacteria bacterium]|nr:hypothetical protein [Candidatus Latescibacterota bacterium]
MPVESVQTACSSATRPLLSSFDIECDRLVDEIASAAWRELFDSVDVTLNKERLYPIIRSAIASALRRHLIHYCG